MSARRGIALVVAVCALGAVALGCSRQGRAGDRSSVAADGGAGWLHDPPSARPTGPCLRPLAEACVGGPCPTYAQRERELRDLVARFGDGGCPAQARLGRCGALRYIEEDMVYERSTHFFDDAGTLVAVTRNADMNGFCDGTAFGATYGTLPGCGREVTLDLCAGRRPPH